MSVLRLQEISLSLNLEGGDVPFIIDMLRSADPAERHTAMDVAAEFIGNGFEQLRARVIDLLGGASTPDDARIAAALAFGPILEACAVAGYHDGSGGGAPLPRETFERVVGALRAIHSDRAAAQLLRRKALEAAVRAAAPPADGMSRVVAHAVDWVDAAVRAAFASDDTEWLETAIFCSGYVDADYTREISSALNATDEDVAFAAVFAARDITLSAQDIDRLAGFAADPEVNLVVRCGAIEALSAQRTDASRAPLFELVGDAEEVVSSAAAEALAQPTMPPFDEASFIDELDALSELGDA